MFECAEQEIYQSLGGWYRSQWEVAFSFVWRHYRLGLWCIYA